MALILTKAGLAALVEAEESGTKLQATHMALGDGNGSIPEHTTSSPSLVNEVWRGALQSITINEQGETDAGKQVVFEAHVPMNAGGWYIREAALHAGDVLLAIGTHPVMWKPAPEEPTKMEHVIKAPITFGNAGAVSLIVDPTVVLASQEFVNKQIATHNDSQDAHPQLREALDKHSHGWNEIQDKPSVFPPKSHGHGWDGISGKPAAFPPSGHNHAWSVITSKPSTFPPSEHSHAWAAITGKPTTFPPASHNHAWTEITNKPAAFPPASHTHNQYLGLAGGKMTGHLDFRSGAWVSLEDGAHWITNNDGLGNLNFRVGHDPAEKYTTSGGAIHLEFSHETTGAAPTFNIHLSSSGANNVAGEAVDFSELYSFGADGVLSFNGSRFFGKHFKPTWADVTGKPVGLVEKPVGHIELLPYRPDTLPAHHYMCNGEGLSKTSGAGKRLLSLSSTFKSDWGITENSTHVFLPNLFSGSDGYFLRPVNGSSRRVGNKQSDEFKSHRHLNGDDPYGHYGRSSGTLTQGNHPSSYSAQIAYTSSVGGSETRPKNIGMTPVIYLPPL